MTKLKNFTTFIVILILLTAKLTFTVKAQQATAPQPPTSNYLIGAFYMPHWRIGTQNNSWTTLQWFPNRKPYLGYYDEGNPDVMDWEIKWAREHGINFFIFDWYRCKSNHEDPRINCNTSLGRPITDASLNVGHAINNGFLNARNRNQMQFAIMLTSHHPFGLIFNSIDDLKNNLMPYIINKYLREPNYLKINGRPVIYVFTPQDYAKSLNGDANLALQVNPTIRTAVKNAGLPDPILMAHNPGLPLGNTQGSEYMKGLGFDYIFGYYTPLSNKRPTGAQAVQLQVESFNSMLATTQPLPFILTASPLWDSTPLRLMGYPANEQKWTLTGPEYQQVLAGAASVANRINPTLLGNKMILVDAWNEISEGHFLTPTAQNGFSYLQAIRAVLTQRNNTPGYALPSAATLQQYSQLYRDYMTHVKNPTEIKASTLTFNGTSDYIDYDNVMTSAPSVISFGGWIKPDAITNPITMVVNKGQSFAMIIKPDGSGLCVMGTENNPWYSRGTTAAFGVGSILIGQYQHLFCVYDGTKLIAYKNGVEISRSVAPISGRLNIHTWRIVLGRSSDQSNIFYKGAIHGFVFATSAHTPTEVIALRNQTNPGGLITPTPTGLITPAPTPTRTPTSTAQPTPTGSFRPADVNRDTFINVIDIGIVIDNYDRRPPTVPRADINNDTYVNILDIGAIVDNYTR